MHLDSLSIHHFPDAIIASFYHMTFSYPLDRFFGGPEVFFLFAKQVGLRKQIMGVLVAGSVLYRYTYVAFSKVFRQV